MSTQPPARISPKETLNFLSIAACVFFCSCSQIQPPHTSPSDFVQIDAHHFFVIRKGEGPPVVILHGLPDHSLNQQRLIDALAEQNTVVAYDRLGLGLSDKPQCSYNIDEQIEDLGRVLAALKLEKPVLVGHSLGGTLAVHFAAAHPEHVSALVLMNPVLIFEPGHTGLRDPGTWFLRQPGLGEIFMTFQNRLITRLALQRMFFDDSKLTDEMIRSYHFPFNEDGTKRHFLGTLRSLYALGTATFSADAAIVKQAALPVLLVWAENDANMPLSDAAVLAERLGAQEVTIPKCGHLPQLELNEARFRTELMGPIEAFLKNLK